MKIKKLAEEGLFSDGDWIESKDQDANGQIRLIQLADIGDGNFVDKSNRFMNRETADKLNCTYLKKGDVLIARMPDPIGRACLFPLEKSESYVTVVDIAILRLSKEHHSKYVMHGLNSPLIRRQIESQVTGTTRLRITKKKIGEIDLPLPPLDQQKKIAAILDAADAYRQKTKALIAKYDELTKSLFLDMFGDPVANPKGWEVRKLQSISTKIHSGNTPKGGSKVYVDEGITFFRSQNVWKNRIVYKDVAFIDEVTHSKMMKSSLKNRDILMTKTGRINTENSSLGRAAMYLGQDDKANVNGHVYLIRLKEDVINEFVLHILTTNEYREYIRGVCVGGIDKRQLNKDHLENFPIISPPIEMQKKFLSHLISIKSHKTKLESVLNKSEDLFNSLLQKAFKGELV